MLTLYQVLLLAMQHGNKHQWVILIKVNARKSMALLIGLIIILLLEGALLCSSEKRPLKKLFSPTGLNIPEAEINAISNNYNVTITKTERKPTRTCTIGGVATIKNSCVFANGCMAITQSADFTGNVTWPAAPAINLSTADSHIKINTQIDLVETTQSCMVEGDNGLMQAADKKAKRACVSVYELPPKNVAVTSTGVSQKLFGGSPKLLYRYWSGAIQGGCIQ